MSLSIKSFAKGEVIFREGGTSRYAYFVTKGKVEISVMRDGRKVILEKVGTGRCFGEMATIVGDTRNATAVALEYTETYPVDSTTLEQLIQDSHPLVRTMTYALMDRVKHLTQNAAPHVAPSNVLVAFAKILELSARAEGGRETRRKPQQSVNLPYAECIDTLSLSSSLPPFRVKAIFKRMANLNLVEVTGIGERATVRFNPDDIVDHARNLTFNMNTLITDRLHADVELIELDELARLVDAPEERILKKLAQDEFPRDLYLFKRSEALNLLDKLGKEGFSKRRIKRVDEFEQLADIEFLDLDSLGRVLSAMNAYDLSLLLKEQPGEVRERALSALSGRMRQVIEDTIGSIEQVDDIKAAQLEHELLESIKRLAAR